MADTKVHEGDKVSWQWGSANPSGTVSEVKPGEVTVTSHRGNDISKSGDSSNPAVHISRPGNDVVKLASEVSVDKPAATSSEEPKKEEPKKEEAKKEEPTKEEVKKDEPKKIEKIAGTNGETKSVDKEKTADKPVEKVAEKSEDKPKDKPEQNGSKAAEVKKDEPKTGEKRKADELHKDAEVLKAAEAPKAAESTTEKSEANGTTDHDAKKQKTETENTGTLEKRGPGRPKGGSKKEKKERPAPAVGRAERKTRSQGTA